MRKKFLILAPITLLAILVGSFIFFNKKPETATKKEAPNYQIEAKIDKNTKETPKSKTVKKNPESKTQKYSLSDPTSIWVVVNKKRSISTAYIPANLAIPNVPTDPGDGKEEKQVNKQIISSVESLFSDAKKQGYDLFLASGYRSAKLQSTVYNSYVARDGQAAADKYSAKPGTSEHQTGWAFDIANSNRKCYLDICFGDTDAGKWIANNAHEYGFTIRYRKDKESITGYQYEPWHLRYVGTELAKKLYDNNQTLEEYFKL